MMVALFRDEVSVIPTLTTEDDYRCGGTLIAPDLMLTAAHCLWADGAYRFTVGHGKQLLSGYLGADHRVMTSAPSGSVIAGYWMHPEYGIDRLDEYDLALVKLRKSFADKPVPFIRNLAEEKQWASTGVKAVLTGWGTTNADQDVRPDDLRRGVLPILPREQCSAVSEAHGFPGYFDKDMMCAGGGKVDACHGDSGSPLLVKGKDGRPTIVGVDSFGWDDKCGVIGEPSYFARMAIGAAWVEGCMADPRRCAGTTDRYCRVEGYCKKTNSDVFRRERTGAPATNPAECHKLAKETFHSCGNDADEDSEIVASYVDASGTSVQKFPACAVAGPCRKSGQPEGFYTAAGDEAACRAQAESQHRSCMNRQNEPVTAAWTAPNGLKLHQFPAGFAAGLSAPPTL